MTTAAKSNKTAATEPSDEMIQGALKFYEEALKSGIQLQEDALKLWKEVLDQVGSPEDLRKKLEQLMKEGLPKSRERMDDVVALFQQNADQCTDIFSKTLNVYHAGSIPEGQARLHELVETSLGVLRSNVHAVVDANTKVMKTWDGIFSKR